MSLFQKVMPARELAKPEKSHTLIADLDEIIAEVYVIKILGREFELKPIIGKNLKELDQACGKALNVGRRLSLGENVSYDEIIQTYHTFCKQMMPDLTLDHLTQMTVTQVNKLFQLCFKHATQQDLKLSDDSESDAQKKNPMPPNLIS